MSIIDMTGKKIGRLLVVGRGKRSNGGEAYWICRCDCGKEKEIRGANLRNGNSFSCGCLQKEKASAATTTHGFTKGKKPTKEYVSWSKMIARCEYPGSHRYDRYGGRGISVCARWRSSFDAFLADMGNKPTPKHTLDRINNDGNYEPGNCRWATMLEQRHNH